MPISAGQPVGIERVIFNDAEFDGQLIRALDVVYDRGADVGECIVTARRIVEGDRDSWLREWNALGDRVSALAAASEAAGRRVSARLAYQRASTYYRTAGVFLYVPGFDARFIKSYQAQRNAFTKAVTLGDWRTEVVQMPYEQTTLEGYFITPAGSGPFRTVVLVDGYDGTKEEMFFAGGVAALERGYAVLLVDGPGQGGALIEHRLYFRPDWEAVVTPQIDWLLTRPEVDAQRIVLVGRSWGGYLAPRVATAEHRVAAVVADAAQYEPGAGGAYLLPEQFREHAYTGDPGRLNEVLRKGMAADLRLAFNLNRGMLTHGMDTPIEYIRAVREYTLKGLSERITCPVLICAAESDVRGGGGKPLYDAITAPGKKYILFTNAEGAGQHDEAGAAALFAQRAFDWLDEVLDGVS